MAYRCQKRNLPSRRNNNQIASYRKQATPFSSNLSNNMNFGGKNNDVSGYVCRELIMEDSNGNRKVAREVQFFNSMKHISEIKVK